MSKNDAILIELFSIITILFAGAPIMSEKYVAFSWHFVVIIGFLIGAIGLAYGLYAEE